MGHGTKFCQNAKAERNIIPWHFQGQTAIVCGVNYGSLYNCSRNQKCFNHNMNNMSVGRFTP